MPNHHRNVDCTMIATGSARTGKLGRTQVRQDLVRATFVKTYSLVMMSNERTLLQRQTAVDPSTVLIEVQHVFFAHNQLERRDRLW